MLAVNNQQPSEVMGTAEIGSWFKGPGLYIYIYTHTYICMSVWVSVCEGSDTLCRENPMFSEAPCLMGGREVNSTAPRLYLIFIHMNAPGPDRLLQTN